MTAWEYTVGVVALAGMVVPVVLTSRLLRARWLPDWYGSRALLADAVMTIAILTSVGQVLGSIGLFRRWVVVDTCLFLAGAAFGWVPRSPDRFDERALPRVDRSSPLFRAMTAVSVVAAAVVFVHWLSRTMYEFKGGIVDGESLNYHLPFAARFVQDGWVTGVHFVSGNATAFYPANGELAHAIAILPFHRDLLSPFVNLGWLALALLAGWCVGRPFGAAPTTLTATTLVVGAPTIMRFNAGNSGTDIGTLALTLAVVAFLVNSRWSPAEVGLAGITAGLAIGTKLNVLPPLAFLLLVVPLAIPAPIRRARAALWLLAAAVPSSLWFVRNAVATGNPLPWLRLGIGPVALPSQSHPDPAFELGVPLFRYGTDSGNWPELSAGLNDGLGRVWPLVLLLTLAGLVAAIATGRAPIHRLLGGFVVVAVMAHAANPLTAGGNGFFYINLRYVTPALATGMVLLALVPALAGIRRQAVVLGVCVTAFAVTTHGYAASDPGEHIPVLGPLFLAATAGAALLATCLIAFRPVPIDRRHRHALVAIVLTVGLGIGWGAQGKYFEVRYLARERQPAVDHVQQGPGVTGADRWAQRISDQHIASAGNRSYPLYGSDLSNRVSIPRRFSSRGDAPPITTCRGWRRALAEGSYSYVVIGTNIFESVPPEVGWTSTISGVGEVVRDETSWVFRLPTKVSSEGCP